MAIDFFDGFDLYGSLTGLQDRWGVLSTPTFSTAGGRFGKGAVGNGSGSAGVVYYTPASMLEYVTVGFAVKSDLAVAATVYAWRDRVASASTFDTNLGFKINSDGSVSALGNRETVVGTSATGLVSQGLWYYIEVQGRRHGTLGSIEIFIGGTSVLAVSSVDTLESTDDGSFYFLPNSSSTEVVMDDIYISQDASALPAALGDVKVTTLLPDGDTAQADWTPLSGSGFSNINDPLGTDGDGNGSYIGETTLNGKSEFDVESLPETPTAIHSVGLSTRASKTDAGSIEYKHHIDSSGTESPGAAIAPSETGYAMDTTIYNTDPNTASAWTESGVNAVKVGVEVTG